LYLDPSTDIEIEGRETHLGFIRIGWTTGRAENPIVCEGSSFAAVAALREHTIVDSGPPETIASLSLSQYQAVRSLIDHPTPSC